MANLYRQTPTGFERLDSFPLDNTSVYDTIEKARQYAKSPTAYDLQIIGVKDGNEPKAYIIYNKELHELSSKTQDEDIYIASNESEMLSLGLTKVGSKVFRSDTGDYYVLTGSDSSLITNWSVENISKVIWEEIVESTNDEVIDNVENS